MKTINDLSENQRWEKRQQDGCSSTSSENSQRLPLLDREIILHIWRVMGSLYLQKWTTSFPAGEIDPGNVWAACLRGLCADDVKRGLNAMVEKRLEWPPSAIDFLVLCDTLDVPSLGSATQGLISALSEPLGSRAWGNYHPCIFWCYTQIGSFDCDNLKTSELVDRFKNLWPLAVELYKKDGITVPDRIRIEKKEAHPANAEVARKALAEINEMMGR